MTTHCRASAALGKFSVMESSRTLEGLRKDTVDFGKTKKAIETAFTIFIAVSFQCYLLCSPLVRVKRS